MNGAVGGAMVMNAIGSISKTIGGGKKGGSSGGSKGSSSSDDNIRWENRSSSDDQDVASLIGEDIQNLGNDNTLRDNNQINLNEGNVFPDDEMSDYYNNPQNYLNDSQDYLDDPDSLDIRMAEIEDEDYNYTSNPEWLALNEQKNQIREQEDLELEPKLDLEIENNTDQDKGLKGPKLNLRTKFKAAAPILGRGVKHVGKGVAKAYGAAAIGTLGVAAGLASENYSNVLSYGATGAAAGSALVSGGINKAKALPSDIYRKVSNINDEYKKNLYADDPAAYKQYMNDKSDDAFMKDKNVQQKYKDKFGTKKYKEAMEKAKKYREHGITDNDVIIKAMKAKVKGVSDDLDASQRIAAAKCAKEVNNEKDIQTMSDRLRKKETISEDRIIANEELLREIRDLNRF